jgi:hypothetical protein
MSPAGTTDDSQRLNRREEIRRIGMNPHGQLKTPTTPQLQPLTNSQPDFLPGIRALCHHPQGKERQMDSKGIGVVVFAVGLLVLLIGVLIYLGALSWFGRLPGDIRIEKENVSIYVPITSMILLSVALSLLIYLIGRVFK